MGSDIAKEMLKDFDEAALRQIAAAAFYRASILRGKHSDEAFAIDDARRFDNLAFAIGALWPAKDID